MSTDTTPNDNYLALEHVVTGSFDPNDKTMLQGDDITEQQVADGDYLDYLIRFQNTGNDTAFLVVIRDTLDNKLDWNSFEMISSSHNYSLAIRDGKYIAWTFDNILLPDSFVDEPGSHGYICYRIKPKNNLIGGDIIRNTAHIFFDYNAPVATNTAITTISTPVNISSNPENNNLLIYPNPTTGEFSIQIPKSKIRKVELYNILGKKVYEDILNTHHQTLNLTLSKGIYFLHCITDNGSGQVKLVKQ
jgi:uncharacterized repeat protein (TIGR01451 family)